MANAETLRDKSVKLSITGQRLFTCRDMKSLERFYSIILVYCADPGTDPNPNPNLVLT